MSPRVRLLVAALAVVTPACNQAERVDLAFRVPPGRDLAYSVDVRSEVVTELAGPPERTVEHLHLAARQRVIRRTADGVVHLEIRMTPRGERPRVFEVRLDTGRGVAAIDTVGGLPVEALGELSPSRFILPISGLVPPTPVRPGDLWPIERTLDLPQGRERLTGTGRLEGLDAGPPVALARVRARTTLPVRQRTTLREGTVVLSGREHTSATVDYSVADGAVVAAASLTTGRFRLLVSPPGGLVSPPIRGTLEVRVRSVTHLDRRPRSAAPGLLQLGTEHDHDIGVLRAGKG